MRLTKPAAMKLTRSVLTVGDGRGFVVEVPRRNPRFRVPERVIITAAHCLPQLPPAHAAAHYWERTYDKLLGPLGATTPSVMAECYFVDPIADLAVLGTPDDQELSDEADDYEALVAAAEPLPVRDIMPNVAGRQFRGRLLSLTGEWFTCNVTSPAGGALDVVDAAQDIVAGMSGSPIVQGSVAVGVVCVSSGGIDGGHRQGGPNPRLVHALPAQMVRRNSARK